LLFVSSLAHECELKVRRESIPFLLQLTFSPGEIFDAGLQDIQRVTDQRSALRRDLDAPLAEGCEVPAEVLNKIQHTIRESLLATASVAIRESSGCRRGVFASESTIAAALFGEKGNSYADSPCSPAVLH
jgi:hypothetical protein